MNTLLSRLIVYINSCVKKDVIYEIARYIIKNYSYCQNITLKDIMDECYVSRASVTRFCEYFGFHSWNNFQSFLVKTKKVKEQQIESRFSNIDMESIYDHLCYIAKNDSLEFKNNLKKEINALVEIINQSSRIYLFGAVYPLSLAVDFQINMISIGKTVYSDFQSESDYLEPMNEDDLAIILTASGRYVGEYKSKFNLICNNAGKKAVISCSNRYSSLQYINHYLYIPTTNKNSFVDFDYYTILILDLIYIEYNLKYCRGK